MRRPRSLLCLLPFMASVMGCHTTEQLSPPPVEGIETGILVLQGDEDQTFAYVFDASDPALPSFRLQGGGALYLVSFDCDLETLSLTPGFQSLADEPAEEALLPPVRGVKRFVVGAEDADWEDMGTPPEEVERVLRRLPAPADNLCQLTRAEYETVLQNVRVPESDDQLVVPTFAVPVGEQRYLLGTKFVIDLNETETRGSSVYQVAADNAVSQDPAVSDLGLLLAGFPLNDGSVYLAGATQLWRGHPDSGFELVATSTGGPVPREMRITGSPSGDELYIATAADVAGGVVGEGTLTSLRRLFRLAGDRLELLLEREVESRNNGRIALAWAEQGRVFAIGLSEQKGFLTELNGDEFTEAEVGPGLQYVQVVDGLGVTVAGRDELYLENAEGAFEAIPSPRIPRVGHIWAPETGGVDILGWNGSDDGTGVTQFHPDLGDCGFEGAPGTFPLFVARGGDLGWLIPMRAVLGGRLLFGRMRRTAPTKTVSSVCRP